MGPGGNDILSAYRTVAMINEEHGVALVQNIYSGKFFVRKDLSVYQKSIYDFLIAHPVENMPEVMEAFEHDGILTVIEEYMSGDTLDSVLSERGTLTEDEVIRTGTGICKILAVLHSFDPPIIHRDIKPANIILSPDGVVKLLDMNAAKWYSEDKSRDTRLIGTEGFAAPEQFGFRQSGPETDIYALGVLMNVLLTGKSPSECPAKGRLGDIIAKCTEMDPEKRFRSADELADALKPHGGSRIIKDWYRFLPPGFRNLDPAHMAVGALGYAGIISVTSSMEVTNAGPYEIIVDRIGMTIALILVVFFSFNYLDIHSMLPFTSSRNVAVKTIGIVVFDVLIFFAMLLITLLVGTVFRW